MHVRKNLRACQMPKKREFREYAIEEISGMRCNCFPCALCPQSSPISRTTRAHVKTMFAEHNEQSGEVLFIRFDSLVELQIPIPGK